MKKKPTKSLTVVAAHMDALDRITDQVLAYRPKATTPKQKKRKRKARKKRLDRDSGAEGHNGVRGT